MDEILKLTNKAVLDPHYADLLGIVKGVRNGAVYGAKVRFPHALVMTFLFRDGSLQSKIRMILKATKEHAQNLALFVGLYKTVLALCRRTREDRKQRDSDSLLAGAIGGYFVFGRQQSSINQQIVLYSFARFVLGFVKFLSKQTQFPKPFSSVTGRTISWSIFSSSVWGLIMYLFTIDADSLMPSLHRSMDYLYLDSNHWSSLKTLIWHNK
ncbi:Tim17/Tim22/Tim23/Pmp24 family-domain-containing protein [Lipomyces oligophaga]|uniref:Tim17/Tim22/Tim23/Pmp24 family-domain-containing protein n=1 Tax=Lipomyces oligophaga TaxID=45792 RepID=UPI0034CD543B